MITTDQTPSTVRISPRPFDPLDGLSPKAKGPALPPDIESITLAPSSIVKVPTYQPIAVPPALPIPEPRTLAMSGLIAMSMVFRKRRKIICVQPAYEAH